MTIKEFAKRYNVKERIARKWIRCGYIPEANIENDYIPDSARVPYTKARAKTADAIYVSIVKASRNRMHVVPQIYGLTQAEFDGYIRRLEDAGLIVLRVTDNVTYYDATINAINFSRKFILEAIEACSKGLAGGVTEACLEKL